MSVHFPSGPWVGFYTYAGYSRRYMMDLVLEFKGGRITGEGADDVGLFVIAGHYSEQTGECGWAKQYVDRHAVDYTGFRDGKGIWGNWTLPIAKGGFHIWPLSDTAPANAMKESEPVEEMAPAGGSPVGAGINCANAFSLSGFP